MTKNFMKNVQKNNQIDLKTSKNILAIIIFVK